MVKEQFRWIQDTKEVTHIKFGVRNHNDIQKLAVANVVSKDLYNQGTKRVPMQFGVLDLRMGTSRHQFKCNTCGKSHVDCIGHFGYIDLQLPVFHVGYFRAVIDILQTICKNPLCARITIPEPEMTVFHAKIRKARDSYLSRKILRKQIHARAKKSTTCPHCGEINGVVKKCGLLQISHEKFRNKKDLVIEEKLAELDQAIEFNKEIEQVSKHWIVEHLTPLDILNLFQAIPLKDIPLLLMNPDAGLPKDLLLTRIPVPPNCIRPSVLSDMREGTNEDDLTMKLSEILLMNNVISKHRAGGVKPQMLIDDWSFLQLHCALYINSEMSGIPFNMRPKKASRGLIQRLKGKTGRFRGNLSGKRVDFTSRTVISPDPNLKIDQVGVPIFVAKILTYPEKVFPANKEWLQKLVRNGPEVHPGANFVVKSENNAKIFLKYGKRENVAEQLKEGDVVERHLTDGDVVLFNRQPSLHKLSIMCHRAKVHEHRTFRFNECNCTPYNADFDGDEMNLHLVQTEEAKAEALVLMANTSNLVTPRSGELLIGATQDFITGAYLLTQRDNFLDRKQISRLLGWLLSDDQIDMDIDLPKPTILKPKKLWTGKQVISVLLKPNKKMKINVNIRAKGRLYTNDEDMCVKDSFVVVRNSELLLGSLDKSTIGSGGKDNIFYVLLRDWGKEAAATAMWRLSRVTSYYLMLRGFSMGLGDVMPSKRLLQQKRNLLNQGYTKCEEYIKEMESGRLECQPGLSEEQTLEAVILKELSVIRDRAGKACINELHRSNGPLIMALSGSKGSVINISQMIACVGQQAINGKRVPEGFIERTLPHFKHNSKTPEAKGFVENSFYSGLFATEFFFHTMAGREGLVDTAVKTAETGYMQRRLVKALEDLSVQYDNTVRNSSGDVVQFEYGGDGLDPTYMEGNGNPVQLGRVFENVRANYPCRNEPILKPNEIMENTERILSSQQYELCNEVFKSDLRKFAEEITEQVEKIVDSKYAVCLEPHRLTKTQHEIFLNTAFNKYRESLIEPGTAVGALAAQSIGEPGTQMTLKTFHFAGVASMNITQGVPRIKEIINATKNISTPVVTAYLDNDADETFARKMKGRIEKTTLGEVSLYMEELYTDCNCYLAIKLDLDRIKMLQLGIDAYSIVKSICASKAGIKAQQVLVEAPDEILISANEITENVSLELFTYRDLLQDVTVQGLPSIYRAHINADTVQGVTHYKLMVEGDNLSGVMAVPGINGIKCTSNNTLEVFGALGIEAARSTIMTEVKSVMENHGMIVDHRHVMLVADLMTCRGEPLGITRHGLAKMKESVLSLASFEKTADHLFDAAYYGQEDAITGISESIIMGTQMPIGTGMFKLVQKTEKKELNRRPLLFDNLIYHDTEA